MQSDAEIIEELSKYNKKLVYFTVKLRVKIPQLTEQIGLNSKKSSKPPSSDKPSKSGPKPLKPTRKRGGQPGHPGHFRRPQAPPDTAIPCCPYSSCACGNECEVMSQPRRHQVFELHKIKPICSEHQLFCVRCKHCQTTKEATLPPGVTTGMLGPRLLIWAGLLTMQYRISRHNGAHLFLDFLGLKLSVAPLSSQERHLGTGLAQADAELAQWFREQHVQFLDESGWRQGNTDRENPESRRAWICVQTNPLATLFIFTLSESRKILKVLLDKFFLGFICSDRYRVYAYLSKQQRGVCWAHMLRDFQRISECDWPAGELGEAFQIQAFNMLTRHSACKDGETDHQGFVTESQSIRANLLELLEYGARFLHAPTACIYRNLVEIERCLWHFVELEGLEPLKIQLLASVAALKMKRSPLILQNVCCERLS
ncbi:MAG: IS66 family transposase [Candidatus Sericytochromatia bacterium]